MRTAAAPATTRIPDASSTNLVALRLHEPAILTTPRASPMAPATAAATPSAIRITMWKAANATPRSESSVPDCRAVIPEVRATVAARPKPNAPR